MASISPIQIVKHRALRKAAGLTGCISGRPVPEMDFFGYKDVQIWFRDASGRLNGDADFNRRDPYCFCFDCRDAFDPEGTLDAELVNEGHKRARIIYASLLQEPVAEVLPARTLTEHPEAYKMDVPRETWFPAAPLPQRSMTNVPWALPKLEIPEGVPPISLPAPRHRDVMNETRETRIRNDLLEKISDFRAELIEVMDSRRTLYEGDRIPDSDEPRRLLDRREEDLWKKINAAELLIEALSQ